MVFSSLFFVFFFLPLVILTYYILSKPLRNGFLFIVSIFFYAWGEPVYVVLMLASIIINYCMGLLLERYHDNQNRREILLISSLILNVGCLIFFKYLGMIFCTIAFWGGMEMPYFNLSLPIGISFYTFQALSYVIDVYTRKVEPQRNLIRFGLYIALFPQLIAGPIINYKDIERQLINRCESWGKFCSGSRRFICGLAKKVLLANNLGLFWMEVKEIPYSELSVVLAWLGIITFTLQIYFDFSGYSDMAIGLGELFGFKFKDNFKYPYTSKDVTEFWRRWHISLGLWFKEYVYFPLGGSREGKWKMLRNLFVVWMLTGLWHGASWNFVFWGLYFGVILMIEKLFLLTYLKKCPNFIRHLYTLLMVVGGWIFFEFANLKEGLYLLKTMIGLGTASLIDERTLVQMNWGFIIILIGIVASTPYPKLWMLWLKEKNKALSITLSSVGTCILLMISTAYMVGATYNPFLYFRF